MLLFKKSKEKRENHLFLKIKNKTISATTPKRIKLVFLKEKKALNGALPESKVIFHLLALCLLPYFLSLCLFLVFLILLEKQSCRFL